MEYETIVGLSRQQIRDIAEWIRKFFCIKTLCFPVMKVLNLIELKFPDQVYHIVEEDSLFEKDCMAYLSAEEDDCYCIHIRRTVYEGACKGHRSHLSFINHEIAHFFLVHVCGVKPRYNATGKPIVYARKVVPCYRSTEWQAMALSGELMIPYDKCKDMTFDQIVAKTKSTDSQTKYFLEKVVPNVKE